jgi:AcrR family transcriptional regulator
MATRSKETARPLHAAHSAKQERSRETLARILAAAEELLETREFDELTMADLAEHAGCGVGTVYGRLPNKESLLVCLHERYMEVGLASSGSMFERCRNAELDERVESLCAMMVDFFAANRGVTRAITNYLFARPSEDLSADVRAFRREATAGFKQAAAFLAEKVDRKIHPVPQVACEFGLQAATDVAQSRVVFGDRSGVRINYSSKDLKARLAALLLAYLRHG